MENSNSNSNSNPCLFQFKNVPFNAWSEILKRAQAKTLGKCMCVCKTWYTLIKSPNFITTHALTQSQKQTHQMLLRNFTKMPQKPGKEIYHILSDPQKGPLKTHMEFPCPFNSLRYFRIVGAVNGVICLSDDMVCYTYTFILWNPFICKFIELPEPRAKFNVIGPFMCVLGFGYDSVKDDYKVVRLTYPQDREGLDEIPPCVELYSVREGVWRWVNGDNVDYCIVERMWSHCFLRGCVHWVAFEKRGDDGGFKSNLLLLFDVEQEKFKRMKLPSELMEVCPLLLGVFEFKGLLSVRYYQRRGGVVGELTRFDMWVKEVYNDGKSWSKMFSIDLESLGIGRVLYLRGNGEIVAANESQEVVCYDPETKQMVCLEKNGKFGSYGACACPFTESLVFLEADSPAVSYEEDHDCRSRSSPGTADAEKVDESRNSNGENENSLTEMEMDMTAFMGTAVVIYYQMLKFRHQFF